MTTYLQLATSAPVLPELHHVKISRDDEVRLRQRSFQVDDHWYQGARLYSIPAGGSRETDVDIIFPFDPLSR